MEGGRRRTNGEEREEGEGEGNSTVLSGRRPSDTVQKGQGILNLIKKKECFSIRKKTLFVMKKEKY